MPWLPPALPLQQVVIGGRNARRIQRSAHRSKETTESLSSQRNPDLVPSICLSSSQGLLLRLSLPGEQADLRGRPPTGQLHAGDCSPRLWRTDGSRKGHASGEPEKVRGHLLRRKRPLENLQSSRVAGMSEQVRVGDRGPGGDCVCFQVFRLS